MKKLNILIAASEVVPFAKTGGLADVAGALPKALKKLGHNVIVVMPRYYSIDPSELKLLEGAMGVPMGPMGELWSAVYESTLPNSEVPIYFMALDVEGRVLQRMRSFTHMMPGEVQGCVGCHADRNSVAPKMLKRMAMRSAVQELRKPDWGVAGFRYDQVVQLVSVYYLMIMMG